MEVTRYGLLGEDARRMTMRSAPPTNDATLMRATTWKPWPGLAGERALHGGVDATHPTLRDRPEHLEVPLPLPDAQMGKIPQRSRHERFGGRSGERLLRGQRVRRDGAERVGGEGPHEREGLGEVVAHLRVRHGRTIHARVPGAFRAGVSPTSVGFSGGRRFSFDRPPAIR